MVYRSTSRAVTRRTEIRAIRMARRGAETVEAAPADIDPDHFDFEAVGIHDDGREEVLERVTNIPFEWAHGARERLEQKYGLEE